MATPIVADDISFTTHQLHMRFTETGIVTGSGSGFTYQKDEVIYLITNWHNVSGRRPDTGKCLSETLAIPDEISTTFREPASLGACHREFFPLYSDTAMLEPVWYEHPQHRCAVDVVAIPLPKEIYAKYKMSPINAIPFDSSFKEWVADDAFVIGYPFFDPPPAQLPIWKRASIASEPDVDIDKLPKMYIDTATRPGLSGSPVVMQRVGIHGMTGGVVKGDEIIGRIRKFVGVYSGRIGNDELKAQLGIVWKARVIDEIINAKVLGQLPGLAHPQKGP
jgi:hypothetical protein